VWAVNGATPTLIAGLRALLIQTLHPGAMAGVHDWSRFREDPMGRLSGTVRWVLTVTYGDTEQAQAACKRVGRIHERVAGNYQDAQGVEKPYSANDQDLLSWVHIAFTEAFLGAHLTWGGPIPGGADAYVYEWARSGVLMGVENPPTSVAELRAQLAGFASELKPDERVQAAVQFLRSPPLGRAGGIGYRVFFAGAVASLPPEYRRLLGLRRPWWPALTAAGIALWLMGVLLGRNSAGESAARTRLRKLEKLPEADAASQESRPSA
jgi:uncharacterized protein (DUF2236 family)